MELGFEIISSTQENKPLILAFGGLSNQMSIPIFEFKRFLITNFDVNLIFLRDLDQVWYHQGIRGLGDDIPECVANLKSLISKIKPSKVITIGTSAGGYAAILFGILLEVDAIISFSPQTFLDKENRLLYKDSSRQDYITKLYRILDRSVKSDKEEFLDLLKLPQPIAPVHVVLGIQDSTDILHIRRLQAWPSVIIEEVNDGHSCVRKLRDSGRLLQILKIYLE